MMMNGRWTTQPWRVWSFRTALVTTADSIEAWPTEKPALMDNFFRLVANAAWLKSDLNSCRDGEVQANYRESLQ